MIKNPITGRNIKIGGQTHLKLICDNILPRESLDMNKISCVTHSRQKYTKPDIQFTERKNTHFTNISQIAKELKIDVFSLLGYISNEFEDIKICKNKDAILLIVPGYEPYIGEMVKDYIKDVLTERDFNQ